MLLYRYFSLQWGLDAIQKMEWNVGRMAEFNDPLDCQPIFADAPAKSTALTY